MTINSASSSVKSFDSDDDNIEINTSKTNEEEEKPLTNDNNITTKNDSDLNNKIIKINEDKINNKKIKLPDSIKSNKSWTDFSLHKPIMMALNEINYSAPTKIQATTIPMILNNINILASSLTGSGKTAAFLIPLIQKIIIKNNLFYTNFSIYSLIILPTRELATQCYENCINIASKSKLKIDLIIGKNDINQQFNSLVKGSDIVIATPGRIIDLVKNYKNISLSETEILIFDEADKLLEMGFKAEIEEINNYCCFSNRQTIMFSATINRKVEGIAKNIMNKFINIKENDYISMNERLIQYVFKLKNEDKREAVLLSLTSEYICNSKKVIVFFKTKLECHRFSLICKILKFKYSEIHGDMLQADRIESFNMFRDDKNSILLATDVAARGLDIKGVDVVINYDMPNDPSRYIHRIGRTARIGNEGLSITICNDTELKDLKKIVKKSGNKLFIKNIKEDIIENNIINIKKIENKIKSILSDEKIERELFTAEREAKRAQNMIKYKEDIYNKPKKEWFISKKQKLRNNKLAKKALNFN